MTQLTIMLLVPDRARADVMLNADRIYYRFVTENTEDEGDLPGLGDRFPVVAARLLECMKPQTAEDPLSADDVKVSIFVDNVRQDSATCTEQGLKRMIDELLRLDDSFAFLQGFA